MQGYSLLTQLGSVLYVYVLLVINKMYDKFKGVSIFMKMYLFFSQFNIYLR